MENTWNSDAVGDWWHATICKWFRRNNGHLTLQMVSFQAFWTPCRSILESDATSLLGSFIWSQIQFLTWKSHWRKHRKIFYGTKLCRVLERGWESICVYRFVEDILSKKVFTLLFIAPDPTQLNSTSWIESDRTVWTFSRRVSSQLNSAELAKWVGLSRVEW